MATSSSEDSILAPKDFHLSSSLDSGSRASPNLTKCNLCYKLRRKLYCVNCVQNGKIHSSNSKESYGDKQLRLSELKAVSKNCQEKCLALLEKKQAVDNFVTKIIQAKERINLLKLAINEKNNKVIRRRKQLDLLLDENKTRHTRRPNLERKCQSLLAFISKKGEDMKGLRTTLDSTLVVLKEVRRRKISELRFIFPIDVVQPIKEVESSDVEKALSEATHTAYVRNRWIYTDHSRELQHRIVEPLLPCSGNYSAYKDFLAAQNRSDVPSSSTATSLKDNAAFQISAGLTYTAQFVILIAYILDVRYPFRMSLSEFTSPPKSEQQFSRRVDRLNANILHLCFTQNTNLATLLPECSLHNILQLLDTHMTDLGREGPMEVNAALANKLESAVIHDLDNSEESDSDESDALPVEWEAVPHVQCPEAPAGIVSLPTQIPNPQQSSSMAGGLVNSAAASIASMWRGWTGR